MSPHSNSSPDSSRFKRVGQFVAEAADIDTVWRRRRRRRWIEHGDVETTASSDQLYDKRLQRIDDDTWTRHVNVTPVNDGVVERCNVVTEKRPLAEYETPLHGHRLRTYFTTPPTDKLTTILQLNCCTTNLPHRNARAQYLDMSRCWNGANFCPLVVNLLNNKLYNCCELVRWWCCTTSP